MKPLTRRQKQVLDFLREYISRAGYPPTLREVAERFSFSGPRAAAKHLESLEKKGHINRTPGVSRGLGITGTGFPRAFYLRYDLYRLYFPLLALARYKNSLEVADE